MIKPTRQANLVLLSISLLLVVLGSVHAFSVFLEPLESQFGMSRAASSMVYSLALVCLTFVVLVSYPIYSKVRPGLLIVLVCLMAALGAVVAAYATSAMMVMAGYGVIFGAANGLGYGFGIQLVAMANPNRQGLAIGIITACYALGAALGPGFFAYLLGIGGFKSAMLGLGAVLVLIAPVCCALLIKSKIVFEMKTSFSDHSANRTQIGLLWVGYGAGVAAGLMAIGHAAGIAKAAGGDYPAWMAAMTIAVCNMVGSVGGGWFVDRMSRRLLLAGLPLFSAGCLFALSLAGAGATYGLLGMIGLAYGATIAAYPAAISKTFGPQNGAKVYSRVFTSWGTAGLVGPFVAGFLFDQSRHYRLALVIAGVLGIVSAAAALAFRDQTD